MSDNTYNGWKNYQTWVTALWLDNEYDDYLQWNDRANTLFAESTEEDVTERLHSVACKLSAELENHIKGNTPLTTGLYADLLSASINEVDWFEVAEHYTNDLT